MTASNKAFQDVLDAVPGAWFFTRSDGTFAYVNQGACEALGYTRQELLACTLFDIDPDITQEMLDYLWATTPPNEARTIRVRHRRKDGSIFPVELRAARLLIEGEDVTASYAIDLTDAERTALSNRRLLSAIDQMGSAVVMMDAEGRIEYANPAYLRHTGAQSSEVLGRDWLALENVSEEDVVEGLSQALRAGLPWKGRIQCALQDAEMYEELFLSPFRTEAQQSVGYVAIKRDISEQVRLEQKLLRAQRVEAVGELARGIAHDFNNLLQIVQGQAYLISERPQMGDVQPMLDEIRDAVDRGAALVRQLLAFSRTGTIEMSSLRFDTLLTRLVGMLARTLGPHIQVDWEHSAGAVWVRGNGPQLEQMVLNLCINARDAMSRGGRLRMRLVPGELEGPAVELHIADQGPGLSEAELARIFEPFYTTKAPGQGTGLGLATVQAVVQAHAGTIDVESKPGVGSTFRVVLPVVEGGDEGPPQFPQGQGRLALVVDDEPAVRRITERYLREAGFQVLAASDGLEAEALLSALESVPDIAVLDVVMQRCGGQQLYELMCARGWACPVVFVTGYDFESLAATVSRPGVAVLHKPFTKDALLAQVKELCAGV